MTHFLDDIFRQPSSLLSTIDYLTGAGQPMLESAAAAVRKSRHVYLTGIGSSYYAAFGAAVTTRRSAPLRFSIRVAVRFTCKMPQSFYTLPPSRPIRL